MGYDCSRLGRLIADKRRREGLSLRDAAQLAGINHASFHRIEKGEPANGQNLSYLLAWLGISLEAVQIPTETKVAEPSPQSYAARQKKAKEFGIRVHLRAVRNLDPKTAAALAEAFRCISNLLEITSRNEGR